MAAKKTRDPLAVAFGEIVDARLRAMGRGAKSRLGVHLGAKDPSVAASMTYEVLKNREFLPAAQFIKVAEFLEVQPSELLDEIADWLRERDM